MVTRPKTPSLQERCDIIPSVPILKFVQECNDRGEWATWFPGLGNSVANAFPSWAPESLVLPKMRLMIHDGLIDGCTCGCRGEYEITEKGRSILASFAEEINDKT